MNQQPSAARHWCFTINNPDPDENPVHHLDIEYLVVGFEGQGEDQTPHYQCYACMTNKTRLTHLKKLIPRAHFERMQGTPKQASDYCKKEGLFEEYGIIPRTSGETQQDKWIDIHYLAKTNNIDGFYDEHPQQAFLNASKFQSLVSHYRAPKTSLTVIDARWYIGPSGSGKSLSARNEFPDLYLKPSATKWWPDYNQEAVVLLDDVGKTHGYMLELLKNWADHYPFRAETKGGHTSLIRPTTIIVTTQYHWDDMTDDIELRNAIKRRFKITQFNQNESESHMGVSANFVLPNENIEESFQALMDEPEELVDLSDYF